jgi:hypothetical protein
MLALLLVTQAAYAFYSPPNGRWLSRDPIEEPGHKVLNAMLNSPHRRDRAIVRWQGNREAANLYGFVGNNPVTRSDLLGLTLTIMDSDCIRACDTPNIDEGNIAGVVCYNGKPCPCVWKGDGATHATSPNAKQIVSQCALEHEISHLPDTDCPTKACYRGIVKPRFPRDYYAKADSECKAFRAHASCLTKALTYYSCGVDADCQSQVARELSLILDRVDGWCPR